jgi:peptidoglycan-N-acetylmuramic acid deacetylase
MNKLSVFLLIILLIVLPAGCKDYKPVNPAVNQDSTSNNQKPIKDAPSPAEPVTTPEPAGDKDASHPTTIVTEPDRESYSWYFHPNSNHEIPAVSTDVQAMLADYDAFYVLPNNENKIYLTFDEGYENGFTGRILDILKANNVRAAFFITGHYLKTQPELIKRMKNEGHLVCNHTANHPDLSTVSRDKFEQEINSLEDEYRQLTNLEMDKYLRPPMGIYSPGSLSYGREMGYRVVFWSMAFKDWDITAQPGAEFSYQYVINNIHPGAVILLHAVSQSNTEALDRIIKDLLAAGYKFATFD